jgi:hypothetical protein
VGNRSGDFYTEYGNQTHPGVLLLGFTSKLGVRRVKIVLLTGKNTLILAMILKPKKSDYLEGN